MQANPYPSPQTPVAPTSHSKAVRRVDISHFNDLPDDAMVSVNALAAVFAKGVSTVWRNCQQDPEFPKPIRYGPGCTRFRVGDIRAYQAFKASVSAKPKRLQREKGQVAS